MKNFCKKIFMLFAILFMSLPANLTSALVTHARAEENIVTTQGNKNTKITQNGCSRKIEKTEEIPAIKQNKTESSLNDTVHSDEDKEIQLTIQAIEDGLISPMIGMDDVTPYDFMTRS